MYFDLVNLAEEAQRIRALRERAREQHPAPIAESIADAVARLEARGVTKETMATLLDGLSVELVLTAHPTEVIASRYANPDLAHRHLEQIVSAVLLASVETAGRTVAPGWRAAMDGMAGRARDAYRGLVDAPGFLDYWYGATPIAEISRLRLGSRPAARAAGTLSPKTVRAIPWVFSWMQSRFNLPGWYGLGGALQAVEPARLRDMYAAWPFCRALLDNAEMSLLKADMGIAALYSDLVPDRTLARAVFAMIHDEYVRSCDTILAVTGHAALMDGEPVIQRSVQVEVVGSVHRRRKAQGTGQTAGGRNSLSGRDGRDVQGSGDAHPLGSRGGSARILGRSNPVGEGRLHRTATPYAGPRRRHPDATAPLLLTLRLLTHRRRRAHLDTGTASR